MLVSELIMKTAVLVVKFLVTPTEINQASASRALFVVGSLPLSDNDKPKALDIKLSHFVFPVTRRVSLWIDHSCATAY